MLSQPHTSILPHHSTPHSYTLQTSISNPSQKNKTTQKRNNTPSKIANLGQCQKTLASPIHCFSPPLNTSLHSFRVFHPPPHAQVGIWERRSPNGLTEEEGEDATLSTGLTTSASSPEAGYRPANMCTMAVLPTALLPIIIRCSPCLMMRFKSLTSGGSPCPYTSKEGPAPAPGILTSTFLNSIALSASVMVGTGSVLKSSLVRFFFPKRGNWQPQPV